MEEIQENKKLDKIFKSKEPEYFNEYYHTHKQKVPCKFCGVLVGRMRMCKHVKSKKCQLHQFGCDKDLKMTQLITMEEKMFQMLDKYFENLSLKNI